jgi:anaerobic ribonucleoside-triphosphate reductase activating protein
MAYIHQINDNDPDNTFGFGLVTSVFFNYCSKHCPGCWNEETWARKEETYMANDVLVERVKVALNNTFPYDGKYNLALLGGDAMEDANIDDARYLVEQVSKEFDLRIAVWTGDLVDDYFRRPERFEKQIAFLKDLDILIDGRFLLGLKAPNYPFGSVNQRIFDTKKLYENREVPVEIAIPASLSSQADDVILKLPQHKPALSMSECVRSIYNHDGRHNYARELASILE